MLLVEGLKPVTEISNIEQIGEELLKEFLNKTPLWDFYETWKVDYMNKSDDEEKLLILSYYNHINAGINLLFVVWLFFINNKIFSSEFIVCSIVFTVNYYWCWIYCLKSIFFFNCMYGKFVAWIFWFVYVVWIVWFNVWVWIFIFWNILWTICPILPYLAVFENNIIITFFVFSNVFKILFTVASCGNWFLF